jgi:hypothetical protein
MQRMLTRKERGLGKYDAPLKVQFQRGYDDFKRGRIWILCSLESGIGALIKHLVRT